ncbi:MAG TPA: amidase, partial [Polyangiaceae bacterium]|nr:amidase [Polyangiaceae bacterium]
EQEVKERLLHIEKRNPTLLAIRETFEETALEKARSLPRDSSSIDAMPLYGVPVVIKDSVSRAGKPLRAGRKDAAGAVASQNALLVDRLEKAGAIVIASANMDELAYGVTGTNPHTGQMRNPRDEQRHPGGSSGGSAAAVADGMVPIAIGTDTAGSVRIPASLCGVVGIRPSHGLLPSQGIAPLAPSLDAPGPIARTARDAALMLSVLADKPNIVSPHPTLTARTAIVLAVKGAFAVDVDPKVQALFEQACHVFQSITGRLKSETIDALALAPRASGPIIGAEAALAWQAEFQAHPEWFGEEVAGHLTKGAAIKAVRYLQAQKERQSIVRAIDILFTFSDLLILPTTPIVSTPAQEPGTQLPFLALTVPFSLGGYPAVSVPMGEVDGLPVGLQIVARRGDDYLALAAAIAFEAAFQAARP